MDPLAQKAYNLDRQLGLVQYGGSYYTNLLGVQEKYLYSNNGTWYIILSNGVLHRWGGTIINSTLVDTLSPEYYNNPALLHDAQNPVADFNASELNLQLAGNQLTIGRTTTA